MPPEPIWCWISYAPTWETVAMRALSGPGPAGESHAAPVHRRTSCLESAPARASSRTPTASAVMPWKTFARNSAVAPASITSGRLPGVPAPLRVKTLCDSVACAPRRTVKRDPRVVADVARGDGGVRRRADVDRGAGRAGDLDLGQRDRRARHQDGRTERGCRVADHPEPLHRRLLHVGRDNRGRALRRRTGQPEDRAMAHLAHQPDVALEAQHLPILARRDHDRRSRLWRSAAPARATVWAAP